MSLRFATRNVSGAALLALALAAAAPLCACSDQSPPTVSDQTSQLASSSPAAGSVVAKVQSRDASEALTGYLDGWVREFNVAAIGEYSGTAAMSVPMGDHKTVTADAYEIDLIEDVSDERATYRVTLYFWRGNPLSSSLPAESLAASSTYELERDTVRDDWIITLTSDPPDASPQLAAPQ